MKAKFPDGWNPPRKVDRGEMNTIRRLYNVDRQAWPVDKLAETFKISPEGVTRILKSKYRTKEEVDEEEIGEILQRQADLGEYDQSQSRHHFNKHHLGSTQDRKTWASGTDKLGSDHARSDFITVDPEADSEERRVAPPARPLRAGYTPPRRSKWVTSKMPVSRSSSSNGHVA